MASKKDPNVSSSEKSDEKPVIDPRLDFFSDTFDPLLALNTPGLKVPVSNAKIYDNIAAYNSAKEKKNKEGQEKQQVKEKPGTSKEKLPERRFLPHQLPVQNEKKKVRRNVFTRMQEMQGPLSLLNKCVNEHIKVKIWNRGASRIRGYCTGYVVAFDKYWNMALEEVEEVWTRKKRPKVPALDTVEVPARVRKSLVPPTIEIIKRTKHMETCQRKLDQVLLRGEHVVTIVLLN